VRRANIKYTIATYMTKSADVLSRSCKHTVT